MPKKVLHTFFLTKAIVSGWPLEGIIFPTCDEKYEIINVAAFRTNYLGRVARAPTEGISVGGMITKIAEHLTFWLNLSSKTPVAGKAKIDMESLIHQGMIVVTNNSYSLMSRGRFVLELPAPSRVSIIDRSN